jgi:hypothetical protein
MKVVRAPRARSRLDTPPLLVLRSTQLTRERLLLPRSEPFTP